MCVREGRGGGRQMVNVEARMRVNGGGEKVVV